MAKIDRLIIHSSDTPADRDVSAADIRKWHMEAPRFWSDIAYQYVVRLSGLTEIGRKHNGDSVLEGAEIGAHALGQNARSLGICVVGNGNFNIKQVLALVTLCKTLMKQYGLKPQDVYGHYEFDKTGKTCPGFDVNLLRKALAA